MKVIIPAAGRATRISEQIGGKHKCLIEYNGETLIFRLVRQIIQAGYTDITVVLGYQKDAITEALSLINGIHFVENTDYDKDKNILSLFKAYPVNNHPLLIVEGDIILSDSCIPKLRDLDGNQLIWTANGIFQPDQNGAILFTEANNQIKNIKYVKEYSKEYEKWYKNLGIMYIPEQYAEKYRELLQRYIEKSLQYYFIDPLIDNLDIFPSGIADFGSDQAGSFNTYDALITLYKKINILPKENINSDCIKLIPVDSLRHIEGFSKERAEWLTQKIINEGYWDTPLCVESHTYAVMDGQHRMEAAKYLGLKYLPCLLLDYNEVDVWTLRPGECEVSSGEILERTISGNIYPYKTAKHEFPFIIPKCQIQLDELRRTE